MIDFDLFRGLIQTRIAAIRQSQFETDPETDSVELDQTRVGRLSRMDAMQMQQMSLESKRRQDRELVALERALTRIENGEFGECLECGEPINPKRLEVDLAATLCISCARVLEQ